MFHQESKFLQIPKLRQTLAVLATSFLHHIKTTPYKFVVAMHINISHSDLVESRHTILLGDEDDNFQC